MTTTLTYHWKHLFSGVEGTRTVTINLPAALAEANLNAQMATWNRNPHWKYWR